MLHAQCLSRGYNFASCMFLFGGGVTVAQQILVLLVLVRIQAPELFLAPAFFSVPFSPFPSTIRSDSVTAVRPPLSDQTGKMIKIKGVSGRVLA